MYSASKSKIAIIQKGQAYASTKWAYKSFFEARGFQVDIFPEYNAAQLAPYQVEWHFLGTDTAPRVNGRLKIHEYPSLSIPPFARWKNT